MGFFRKQLLKVIKWEDSASDLIVYRFPMTDREEIMNGSKLIVTESQVAMLVSQGQICDVYTPGSHDLTTNNMPILSKLAGWKFGFDSPFKADVYFVNTKQFINQKWGTSSKVNMRDKDFGMVRVGGRGVYSFRVDDAPKFMREIFGTNREYTTDSLMDYFKSMIVSSFAKTLGKSNIPVLDLQAEYMEIGEMMQEELEDDFANLGLDIVSLYVESIVLPEAVEEAMDKRSTLGVLDGRLGDYTRLQAADAMRDAANNEGGAGGIAGAGMGIAAGMMMGKTFNNNFDNNNQPAQNAQAAQPQPTGAGVCANCHSPLTPGAKFCANCGTPVSQKKFCIKCGHEIPAGAKFCPNCGAQN